MVDTAEITFPLSDSTELANAYLARPASGDGLPAVLVLHEMFGLNDDMRRITRRFAAEGYVALAPNYFGSGFKLGCIVEAMRSARRGSGPTFGRLDAATSWLADQPDVDPRRLGIVGFCMGGGFAILQAARSNARGVATFYGDVPKDVELVRGIPPCVAGYGGRDKLFGPRADRLREHLVELNVTHEIKTYPGAGHSYMSDNTGWLATLGAKGPMRVGFDPDASADSWARMLAFFAEHLAA